LINVAFVANAPFVSGSERCLQIITKQLSNYNINVVLVLGKNSPLREWARANNINFIACELDPLKVRKPTTWIINQIKLTWLFFIKKIDVVHCNQIWCYPVVCLPTSILNIKRICHLRDPLNSHSDWWIPKKIDLAIAVSEHIAKEFKKFVSDNKYHNVISKIDPVIKKAELDLQERKALQKLAKIKFDLNETNYHFGYIGQVAPVKGIVELIYALSKLTNKNWKLLIAGRDPSESQAYISECKNLINELLLSDRVIFLGFLESVDEFYQAIDIVVVPSKDEPLGLIPLEAGMHYKPAIVKNVGGLPETVIDSKSGYIFEDYNQDLIDKLDSAIESNIHEMGEYARQHAEKVSCQQSYLKELSSIYRKMI